MGRVLLVLLTTGMLGADDAATRKDQDAMQGKWQIVSLEVNGETLDLTTPAEIKGDLLHIPSSPLTFRFKLDAGYQPPLFDLDISLVRKDLKFHEQYEGIYELAGDTLKICCVATSGKKERPLTFEAKANSDRQLFILKRVR